MNSISDVWQSVLSRLQEQLSETTIRTWFDEVDVVTMDSAFVLHCSNSFKKSTIETRFMKHIKAALKDIFSSDLEVKILNDEQLAAYHGVAPDQPGSLLDSDAFTFETYVVGPQNKLAYAAARAVADKPAENFNPLFIYGDSGLGKTHIVTNGDQTDTIFDLMSQGKSFADALRTRTFEPDGPNYTPRISAVVYADGSYQMSILKSADGNGDSVQRYFFDYPQPVAGEGHFISTYKHNGNPIPSFEGEPLRFACPRTIGDFAHGLWQNLNPDNKVSLFARVIDLDSGETGDMIFNKYDAVNSDLDDPEEPELLPEELEMLAKLDAEAE